MNKEYVPGFALPEVNTAIQQDIKEQSLNEYMDQSNESVCSKPLDFWDYIFIGLGAVL